MPVCSAWGQGAGVEQGGGSNGVGGCHIGSRRGSGSVVLMCAAPYLLSQTWPLNMGQHWLALVIELIWV